MDEKSLEVIIKLLKVLHYISIATLTLSYLIFMTIDNLTPSITRRHLQFVGFVMMVMAMAMAARFLLEKARR